MSSERYREHSGRVQSRVVGKASFKRRVFIWILMTFIIQTARDKWDIRLYSYMIYQ